jgi:hypothetical protein
MEEFTKALAEYTTTRDSLTVPHNCQAGYVISNMGTDLDAIEPFTVELTGIVDTMQEELAKEVRLLEGVDVPEYAPLENEHLDSETKECQWSNASANGCWTTDRTHACTPELSTSVSIAEPSSLIFPTEQSSGLSSLRSMNCSEGKLERCGCGTDATNESCACMEQTINVPMAGTLSEEK